MALTRQRESAQVFVATETAHNAEDLARQMARGEIKAASVAWATADELTPTQRERAARDQPEAPVERESPGTIHDSPRVTEAADPRDIVVPSPARDSASPAEPPAGEKEQAAPEILIPPYVDPSGRDSLGRGLDEASIAAAVAADRAVQREREALPHYLAGAYRDPYAARARLDEMVKGQGRTSTAARIAREPTQLGELRGNVGFFAGSRAKAERAMAERAASAVAPSLERIAAAEARAVQTYRESVETQCKADATPIPKLTARAETAVATLTAAADEKVRAELWRGITADQVIGPELRRFSAAVQQRFGDDTVRAMLRSHGDRVEVASVPRAHQAAVATVSRTVHTLRQGERADAAERLTQRQTLGLRPRMRP